MEVGFSKLFLSGEQKGVLNLFLKEVIRKKNENLTWKFPLSVGTPPLLITFKLEHNMWRGLHNGKCLSLVQPISVRMSE